VYITKKEQKKAGKINSKIESTREADSEVKNNKNITKDKVKKEKERGESNIKKRDSDAESDNANNIT
jgi:hypothetical protein